MKVKFSPEAQKVINATATNPGKPVLTNICVVNGEAIAIDSFLMLTTKIETTVTAKDEKTLIPANLIKKLRNFSQSSDIDVEVSEGKAVGKITKDGEISYSVPADQSIGYPDSQHLWPHSDFKGFIALSPRLLLKICSLATNLKDKQPIIFRIRGNTEPTEFVVGDFHGVVMPMAVDGESPLWTPIEQIPSKKQGSPE